MTGAESGLNRVRCTAVDPGRGLRTTSRALPSRVAEDEELGRCARVPLFDSGVEEVDERLFIPVLLSLHLDHDPDIAGSIPASLYGDDAAWARNGPPIN